MRAAWISALAVSLTVNLFAGMFLVGQWWERDARIEVDGFLQPWGPLREQVREEIDRDRSILASAVVRLQQARRSLIATAASPEFDRQAMEAALAETRAATHQLQEITQAAFMRAVEQASPEQRQSLAGKP